MAHKLHFVVCGALNLVSHVKPKWDAGTQETWALLEQCRQLVGHFSRSLKAAHQLHERQEELGPDRPAHQMEFHLHHGVPPGGAEGSF